MRLIDADALRYEWDGMITIDIKNAPTICCETCKHGIRGERIGGREYVSCVKPHAEISNYHTKDWFCGDWRDKDAAD